jgi:hypothetical protein
METMLLRLCNELGSTRHSVTTESVTASSTEMIDEGLNHAVFTFQRPIHGVVQSSIPFINDERMYIDLPPRTVFLHFHTATQLVGADGLTF